MRTIMTVLGAPLLGALLLGGAVTGCSPDEGKFQTKAEQVVMEEIRQQLGLDSEVECEAPSSVDVGTTFACTAKAADGTRYTFRAQITGDSELAVSLDP
jgi:hypothetical protein